MSRSSTTLDSARGALLGRISAAVRNQRELSSEQRRARTAAAREARAARRQERARARAAELGFNALSPAELERLEAAVEAERVARLQLAASDAARRRRALR